MYKLEDFRKLVQEYGDKVDFVIVYMAEAHAADGWNLINNRYGGVKEHKTIEDRIHAARQLQVLEPPCPILLDNMADKAGTIFRALPERLVVIRDELVAYEGDRGPVGYSLNTLKASLDRVLIER